MAEMRSGGRILVECLAAQGVTTAFGVPGESYLDVLNALYDHQNAIRMIVTRHESGASFAAEAWGKLTGTPGICFVTRGPGATNASIGVHTAMQNSSPMILFVGQIGRAMRQREAFQEIEYRSFFGGVAKWVTEIDSADRIPETVARAFATALSGRPGPVVIALPEDMLRDMSDVEVAAKVRIATPAPEATLITEACARLKAAKRPLILAGGGGWGDRGKRALQAFAEANALPVAVAFRNQDLIGTASPSFIGDAGVGMLPYLKDMLREADLILALNVRFGETLTDGWTLFDVPKMAAELIHAHVSDRELGKVYQADLPIHGHPDAVAEALAAAGVLGDWSDWCARGRDGFLGMRRNARQTGAVDMVAVAAHLRTVLDADAIITNGAGNFAIWPGKFLDFGGTRRYLAPQSGAMGAGVPSALAAKAHDPARQVVCFAGDGDFQMSLMELGTMAQEGLKPIILILNNGMYGTIRAHQERNYPGRVSATRIVNPDYVALAGAYGFHGERVVRTEDFADAFARCKTAGGGVIEVIIDPEDISPFTTTTAIRNAAEAAGR
jgi:acetolactate synthase-1/2/3 large subunit